MSRSEVLLADTEPTRAPGYWGGWAGIAGIAVPAVGVIIRPIWTFPTTSADGARIASFAAGHRAALQATMLANTVGVVLWLVFGAAVWSRLRAAVPASSMIPTCFAAGLVSFVTLLLTGFTAFDVLVYRIPGPAETQLLYDLTFGLLAMSGPPTAVALTAYALAIHRYRILPVRTAYLAAATALAHVLLLASFVAGSGFLSLEGAVITVIPALLWAWIADTGVCLIRQGRPAT